MRELMPYAEKAAALLKARKETVAVAESSTGGLIAAARLAVPGGSAYFIGGAVIYTRQAGHALRGFAEQVGYGGDGGRRSGRQPLWRRRGPHLHCRRRAG